MTTVLNFAALDAAFTLPEKAEDRQILLALANGNHVPDTYAQVLEQDYGILLESDSKNTTLIAAPFAIGADVESRRFLDNYCENQRNVDLTDAFLSYAMHVGLYNFFAGDSLLVFVEPSNVREFEDTQHEYKNFMQSRLSSVTSDLLSLTVMDTKIANRRSPHELARDTELKQAIWDVQAAETTIRIHEIQEEFEESELVDSEFTDISISTNAARTVLHIIYGDSEVFLTSLVPTPRSKISAPHKAYLSALAYRYGSSADVDTGESEGE